MAEATRGNMAGQTSHAQPFDGGRAMRLWLTPSPPGAGPPLPEGDRATSLRVIADPGHITLSVLHPILPPTPRFQPSGLQLPSVTLPLVPRSQAGLTPVDFPLDAGPPKPHLLTVSTPDC